MFSAKTVDQRYGEVWAARGENFATCPPAYLPNAQLLWAAGQEVVPDGSSFHLNPPIDGAGGMRRAV
jgi:hypothetical protein